MKKLLLSLLLLATPGWAGSSLSTVTISQTLTLTSPSAYISMTGVSSTAYLYDVSSTNISASVITLSGSSLPIPKLVVTLSTTGSSTNCTVLKGYNVSGCTRTGTGEFGVSATQPFSDINYRAICSASGSGNTFWWAGQLGSTSPTTAGLRFKVAAFSGATLEYIDPDYATCAVFD